MVVYYTHDNTGRPYKVEVNTSKKTFTVIKNAFSKENGYTDDYNKPIIVDEPYSKVFVGHDSSVNKKFGEGNSLLFCINDSKHIYTFVGHRVVVFEAQDKIDKYDSPIGNSDVPYPVAFSKQYCYFMLDNICLPNKFERDGQEHDYRSSGPEAYQLFYTMYVWTKNKKITKEFDANKKKVTFPHEILDKR